MGQQTTRTDEALAAGIGHQEPGHLRTATLITLALLAAAAPLSTDLYLPAFPQIATELGATQTAVQLSLTTFFVGAGAGQLIFGPISDRLGRRGPLIIGTAVYLLSGLAAAFSPSITMLILARLAQGLSGAAGMVLGRAIILDLVRGREAARALNLMMVISGIAPVVSPLVGSFLTGPIGWRGLMGIMAGLGAASLACVLIFVPESRSRTLRDPAHARSHSGEWRTLLSRDFAGNALTFGFSQATLFAYISASSFLYQDNMGLSTISYGIIYAINAVGLTGASYGAARLARSGQIRTPTGIALGGAALSVIAICAISLTGTPVRWLMPAIFIAVTALGMTFGNTTALALDTIPVSVSGTASAVLGVLQFILAGLVSPLVSIGGDHSTAAFAFTMLASILIANLGYAIGRTRNHPSPEHLEPLR